VLVPLSGNCRNIYNDNRSIFLYDRVSTGVHSDVDAQEAINLFFNTYLLLGEILTLK
jgi:hypothetical protein